MGSMSVLIRTLEFYLALKIDIGVKPTSTLCDPRSVEVTDRMIETNPRIDDGNFDRMASLAFIADVLVHDCDF